VDLNRTVGSAISGSGVPGPGPPNGGKDADVADPAIVRGIHGSGFGKRT